jgi:hypothetical protein
MLYTAAYEGRVVMDLMPEQKSSLNLEILAVLNAIDQELVRCRADNEAAIRHVKGCISSLLPELQCDVFGSQATGLCLPGKQTT